ncbi:MAG: hypothetical protein ABIM40_02720 [Pseudomonadota bacterium]
MSEAWLFRAGRPSPGSSFRRSLSSRRRGAGIQEKAPGQDFDNRYHIQPLEQIVDMTCHKCGFMADHGEFAYLCKSG